MIFLFVKSISILLNPGDTYTQDLSVESKEALQSLGVSGDAMTEYRGSMALAGRYGCGYLAASFTKRGEGPSYIHLQIEGENDILLIVISTYYFLINLVVSE